MLVSANPEILSKISRGGGACWKKGTTVGVVLVLGVVLGVVLVGMPKAATDWFLSSLYTGFNAVKLYFQVN